MRRVFAFVFVGFAITLVFLFAISLTKQFSLISDKFAVAPTSEPPTPIPTFTPQKIELTGWFAIWDDSLAAKVLPEVIDNFKVYSPMLYRIMADSTLGEHNTRNWNNMLAAAREKNVPIKPVITDESDRTRVKRLLTNSQVQEAFIKEMIDIAKQENFSGWGIDIEMVESGDKQAFTDFVKNASIALHRENLTLDVIVFGRVEKEEYPPALAHDYKDLANYADQIQLMTYNYNNDVTGPGGQTPVAWLRDVLKYATSVIPKEKIVVGLSTHGYDWAEEEVEGLTYPMVEKRIEQFNLQPTLDAKNSAKVAKYKDSGGTEHTIYFEDAETIFQKIRLVQHEFGLNKFALWRTSAEDTAIWDKISE